MSPIIKSAKIERSDISEKELAVINGKYALKSLSADDIFGFKIAICDNQIDRDNECFSEEAILQLSKMFIGKTIISDHIPSAKNQCARIYDTGIEKSGGITRLVAKCYTVHTDATKDFISMLSAGIMKEVSVSCKLKSIICSICGQDNVKSYCSHIGGRTYGEKQCYFTLDDPEDAFEVSFVAVPAQKEAGVIKSYGDKPLKDIPEIPKTDNNVSDAEKEKMLDLDIALAKASMLINENEEENNND